MFALPSCSGYQSSKRRADSFSWLDANQISDVTFTGGGIGLKGGNQQFTAQRLTFRDCTTGIQVIWDWGWVWKSITMTNVKTGFLLVGDGGVGNSGCSPSPLQTPPPSFSGCSTITMGSFYSRDNLLVTLHSSFHPEEVILTLSPSTVGSVAVMDSSFTNVGTAVIINPLTNATGKGSTGVSLENIALSGVSVAVADTTGKTLLTGSASSATIDQWVAGPVYEGSTTARTFSTGGKVGNFRRHSTLLDAKGAYFERPKPQYEDQGIGSFLHVKD